MNDKPEILSLTANIVSAFVGRNPVASSDLRHVINDVYRALRENANGHALNPLLASELKPAVPVKKSLHDEYLICLEDGKRFKSLKRHLRTQYDLSPAQYREKWGLPPEYPMVAPKYAAARSLLAKKIGLGRQRKKKS
jgi:MucR family transcriptional regulator, transcriptional regulator of exopolysaccharide biosynthesis